MQIPDVIPPCAGFEYRLARRLVRFFFWATGGKIYGRDNVPQEGAVIIAPNHVSKWDPPLIHSSVPRHVVLSMAKQEMFRSKIGKYLFPRLACFPVDRDQGDKDAIDQAIACLRKQDGLLLFPEGTRSKNGELQKPKHGLGIIARKAEVDVVIVPTLIWGTGAKGVKRLWGRSVTFGKPIRIPAEIPTTEARQLSPKRICAQVMERIQALEQEALKSRGK